MHIEKMLYGHITRLMDYRAKKCVSNVQINFWLEKDSNSKLQHHSSHTPALPTCIERQSDRQTDRHREKQIERGN